MPPAGSKKEMNSLRELTSDLHDRLKRIEKNQAMISRRLSTLERQGSTPSDPAPAAAASSPQTSSSMPDDPPFVAIALMVIGGLLSLTIIGAVIGIPLLIWGIVLANKASKASAGTGQRTQQSQAKTQPSSPVQAPAKTTPASEPKPEKKESLEETVGTKWFAYIGILALVIGVGFFIKYAIDMNWINHLTRILLAVALGVGLIIGGQLLSRKEQYRLWAKTLVGGGFAITYFAVYAAYHFESYRNAIGISQLTDIVLLILIVVLAIVFSIKDNSQIVAAEAFFLGYATSLLSNNFEMLTLLYSLFLTLGLVFVACYKKWVLIGFGGMLSSYFMYLLWAQQHPDTFMLSAIILVSYFTAFTVQTLALAKSKTSVELNMLVMVVNSLLFFLFFFELLRPDYTGYRGMFTLGLGIFFFFLHSVLHNLEAKKLSFSALCLGLVFVTLAIGVQLDGELVTILWALEAVILTVLYCKTRNGALRIGSYGLGILTALKTLFYDSVLLERLDLVNLLASTRMIAYLVTILCFFAVYRVLTKTPSLPKEDYDAGVLYSWVASVSIVALLILELYDQWSVWITLLLSLMTLVYFVLSAKNKDFRYQCVALSGVLFVKVLLFDAWQLDDFSAHALFESTRVIAFLCAVFVLYFMSATLLRVKDATHEQFQLATLYSYGATLLMFILIIIEMEELWISLGWSVLALAVMVTGFVTGQRHLRLQGMIIFALTIFKVFIYDTRSLVTIYRTVSYMVLGSLLLLVSFIYTKYKEKIKEIL